MKFKSTPSLTISLPKILAGLCITGLLASLSGRAASTPEPLQDLVDIALASNPEIRASEARWEAFKAKAGQAGRFDDPMMMLKLQNGVLTAPLDFSRDPSTAKVVGISQTLPFFGRRALKKAAADSEAASYKWLLEERKLELVRMVKETYFQLYATDRALALVESNSQVLDQISRLAQERYSAGQGIAQDVTKAELEKSRLIEAQYELQQQRTSLVAALNSLLFRDPEAPISATAQPEIQTVVYSSKELVDLAYENRPLIKSYLALIQKAQTNQNLARKENYPDITVSAEYMQRSATRTDRGDDMYSVGVSFNLPFQRDRRRAVVQEATSEATMVHEELKALKNTISRLITTIVAQLSQKERQLMLYSSDILPKARQSFSLVTTEYRTGRVDLLTLLEARNNLLDAEKSYYSTTAEYGSLKGQLEATVGASLGDSP